MAKVVVLGTAHPHVFALATAAQGIEGLELAGVYDADPALREAAAKRLGIPAFASLSEALSGGVSLSLIGAVPTDRVRLAIATLEAGGSVLVDKPLALHASALAELQAASEKYKRPVSVYYPYRGSPLVLAAIEAIRQGRVGTLVRAMSMGPHKLNAPSRPDWHWTRDGNGGALIDIGSHHFDLVCLLAQSRPVWVCATHANFTQPAHPEFQDFAQAQVRFDSGVLAHVEVDWLNPTSMKHFGDTRVWMQGTIGKIELRMGDEVEARIWTPDVAGEKLEPVAHDSAAWDRQLITDLAAGKPGPIPQADVWTTSALSIRAFESAQQGGTPVTL